MKESKFQTELIKDLRKLLKDCVILKNDPTYLQGIPDLIILFKDKWATLEVKSALTAPRQPNQEYYINLLKSMSYAAIVAPENKDEILHGLQLALRSSGTARVS